MDWIDRSDAIILGCMEEIISYQIEYEGGEYSTSL